MWPERRHFTGVGSSSPKAQPPSRQDLGGQSLRQGSDTLGYHFRITGGIPPITLSPWRHWVSPPRSCRPGTWARLPLGISSSALTSCGKVRVSGQGGGPHATEGQCRCAVWQQQRDTHKRPGQTLSSHYISQNWSDWYLRRTEISIIPILRNITVCEQMPVNVCAQRRCAVWQQQRDTHTNGQGKRSPPIIFLKTGAIGISVGRRYQSSQF